MWATNCPFLFLWTKWKKSISERAIIGFDHGLPCPVKNMALGPQLRQKPRPSASVFVYWVPRAMFFTRHGRPRSNPTACYQTASHPATARVGNGYDQAQLRSIKMADAEHGEYRLSRIVSTRHLVRRPYCAWRESWDRLIFWMWETAAARSDIADIGMRKFRRIGRNCHALLIVTAFQSRRLLIVTCLNES